MCGIVATISQGGNVVDFLVKSLKKLEYRGYDSAGIGVINDSNKIATYKAVGEVSFLEEKIAKNDFKKVKLGIGHTRWATHGGVSENNCHPHKSFDGKIALVHNGIIDNYATLKQELLVKNISFTGETDSEVVSNLLATDDSIDFLSKIKNTIVKLHGSYAFAIINEKEPNRIYFAKKNSSLYIAKNINNSDIFITSDLNSLGRNANMFAKIDCVEFGFIDDMQNLHIEGKDAKNVVWQELNIDIEDEKQSEFKDFMSREIYSQPQVITNCLNQQNFDTIKDIDVESISAIHIIACGTSYHSGLQAKSYIEDILDIRTNCYISSEFLVEKNYIGSDDLVFFISQSGETLDTLLAMKKVLENHCPKKVIALVNRENSTMTEGEHLTIYTKAGAEYSVASTKAYTTQITAFMMIINHIYEHKNGSKLITNDNWNKLPLLVEMCLQNNTLKAKNLAKNLATNKGVLYIAKNSQLASAMEGSLKLKEITYIFSFAVASGELKHGTLALVDEKVTSVAILPPKNSPYYDKVLSNLQEISAREGNIIAVGEETDNKADFKIDCDIPIFYDLLSVLPLQILAYEVAKLLGVNIDKPRNLAKSVTVE